MAEPVKTGLCKAIEAMLREVPGIKTVLPWQAPPLDPSQHEPPLMVFWDEEKKEPWNRLDLGKLDFWLMVLFSVNPEDPVSHDTFLKAADEAAGHIQNQFAAPATLRPAGLIQAQAEDVVKGKYMEGYGGLFMIYQLTYAHAAGDAFALNDT